MTTSCYVLVLLVLFCLPLAGSCNFLDSIYTAPAKPVELTAEIVKSSILNAKRKHPVLVLITYPIRSESQCTECKSMRLLQADIALIASRHAKLNNATSLQAYVMYFQGEESQRNAVISMGITSLPTLLYFAPRVATGLDVNMALKRERCQHNRRVLTSAYRPKSQTEKVAGEASKGTKTAKSGKTRKATSPLSTHAAAWISRQSRRARSAEHVNGWAGRTDCFSPLPSALELSAWIDRKSSTKKSTGSVDSLGNKIMGYEAVARVQGDVADRKAVIKSLLLGALALFALSIRALLSGSRLFNEKLIIGLGIVVTTIFVGALSGGLSYATQHQLKWAGSNRVGDVVLKTSREMYEVESFIVCVGAVVSSISLAVAVFVTSRRRPSNAAFIVYMLVAIAAFCMFGVSMAALLTVAIAKNGENSYLSRGYYPPFLLESIGTRKAVLAKLFAVAQPVLALFPVGEVRPAFVQSLIRTTSDWI